MAHAQFYVGEKFKTIYFHADSVIIDSFTLAPQSIRIISSWPDSCFSLDFTKNYIIRNCLLDSVKIAYRVLPLKIHEHFGVDSIPPYISNQFLMSEKIYADANQAHENGDEQTLNLDGMFEQGVSSGTNGNIGFQNYLDLKISSKISDNKAINIILKDKQIPIQPEGTTATLEELDEIYAQFLAPNYNFQAGDYWLKYRQQFLAIDKKIKGIGWEANNENFSVKNHVSKQKGTLMRKTLIAKTGFQGPYMLSDEKEQQNMVVLAGSEKIFVNGRLLKRGSDKDYILDYNTGVLYFNIHYPISSEMRIVAEYEYANSENDMAIFNAVKWSAKKTEISVEHYLNAGAKAGALEMWQKDSFPISLLNGQDFFLQSAKEMVPAVYLPNKAYYIKIDSISEETQFSYFVYSEDSTISRFEIEFSYVGQFKGDYIEIFKGTNYKIYEWKGAGNGHFVAGKTYKVPKQSQWFQISVQSELSSQNYISASILNYRFDINTLSKENKIEQKNAILLNYTDSLHSKKIGQLLISFDFQAQQKELHAPSKILNEEFERNWNLTADFFKGAFEKSAINVKQFRDSIHFNNLEVSALSSNAKLQAFQGIFSSAQRLKKWEIRENTVLSLAKSNVLTYFLAHSHSAELTINKRTFYHLIELEKKNKADSLLETGFWTNTLGMRKLNGLQIQTESYIKLRNKFYFHPKTPKPLFDFFYQAEKEIANQKFLVLAVFQQLNDTAFKVNQLFSYQFRHHFNFLKQLINGNYFVHVSTSAEPEKIEYYLQVPAGQGYYYWIDFNQNNIQEQGEFEKALFHTDAQYLKFYRQGNKTIDYFDKKYHFEITLNGNILENNNFLKNLRLYALADYQFKAEKEKQNNKQDYLFWSKKTHSEALFKKNKISVSGALISNSFFSVYNNGGETKKIANKNILTEYAFKEYLKSTINLGITESQTINEFYTLRNYGYRQIFANQNIIFEKSQTILLSLHYQINYYKTYNQYIGQIQSIGLNNQITNKRTVLTGNIKILKVIYQEKTNTPMAFEILQQHQNGYNLDIELQWKRNILSDIYFTLNYQSKIHQNTVLHSGTILLSKRF